MIAASRACMTPTGASASTRLTEVALGCDQPQCTDGFVETNCWPNLMRLAFINRRRPIMIRPVAKNGPEPVPHVAVTRRHFVRTAAALLGGAGAQALLSTSVRAFDPKLDLRAGNWITPVRNQNTCNWCTAFAAVATIEGTYNKKYFTDGSKQLNLSEGQLFFAAGPKDKCETTHWWPEEALAYCAQVGLTREDDETGIPDRIIK